MIGESKTEATQEGSVSVGHYGKKATPPDQNRAKMPKGEAQMEQSKLRKGEERTRNVASQSSAA